MARGLKMKRARREDRCVYAGSVAKSDRNNLVCEYCNACVTHVDEYSKESSNSVISAHFRLRPNEKHENQCNNRIENYVERIRVSHSQSVEQGMHILEKSKDGKYQFRLNYLEQSNNDIKSAPKPSGGSSGRGGTRYISSKRALAPYFRTAMEITRLRTLVDNMTELKKTIIIKFKGKNILWTNFFFDRSEYHRISNQINHPVALLVMPQCKPLKDKMRNRWNVRCSAVDDSSNGKSVTPYLTFYDVSYAKSIEIGQIYIVLCRPKVCFVALKCGIIFYI